MVNTPSGLSQEELTELLESCANEPIHRLGRIQGFCSLVAFQRSSGEIVFVSDNFKVLGDVAPKDLVGQIVWDHMNDSEAETLRNAFPEGDFKDLILHGHHRRGERLPSLVAYATGDLVVLEFELKSGSLPVDKKAELLNSFIPLQPKAQSLAAIRDTFSVLTEKIAELTKYDRVMVYQFHPDAHGEVVAEARSSRTTDSFLGLHYPESDIPKQARKLYLKNRIRIIEDVDAAPVPVLGKDPTLLDLSDSISRHVSPMHIEYLHNMGVRASLSISIVVRGELWGLIACHHYHESKFFTYEDRMFLRMVSLTLSSFIENQMDLVLADRREELNSLTKKLYDGLVQKEGELNLQFDQLLQKVVRQHADPLLAIVEATGFYLEVGGQKAVIGEIPESHEISILKKVVIESGESCFSTQNLQKLNPGLKDVDPSCTGMIALVVGETKENCFVAWFRPEFIRDVSWAGKDEKQVSLKNGVRRLSPRGSFETYTESQRGLSRSFLGDDETIVEEFIWFLSEVLAGRMISLQSKTLELQELSKMKDLFISNLSHELRTPLNNILGWLQLYKDRFQKEPEMAELYQTLDSNSRHQLSLIEDLLDVSRLASGKLKLSLTETELKPLVSECVQSFAPRFSEKGVQLSLHFGDVPETIVVDSERFLQVVRNLIENSFKFTGKGGSVDVQVQFKDKDVVISVRDTGIGIPKSKIDQIFEPFQQANMTRARKAGGIGLGLSIAKNIVGLHRGTIGISSEGKGKGTLVEVRIPIDLQIVPGSNTKSAQPKSSTISLETLFQGKRVLLVEDTPESAGFLLLYLESLGFQVQWVENAVLALNVLQKESFDVVLSDIGLPGIDGYELRKRATSIAWNKDVPYVAISAYAHKEEIKKSFDAGFQDHIVKPVSLDDLSKKLQRLLSS